MATKMKSNGDGSLKLQSQGIGKTSTTKSESAIGKPKKILREDLEIKKSVLESDGWTFEYNTEKDEWTGTKPGEVGGANFNSLSVLLGYIEKRLEQKTDRSGWYLPLIQQIQINDFIAAHNVGSLYLTENETVEVEYADKKRNVLTSVFFDKLGQHYQKRRPEFGANLSGSILSVKEFHEKFPRLVPEKLLEEVSPTAPPPENTALNISIELIVPSAFQGQERRRQRFTDDEIAELAASIEQQTLLSPIVVRPLENKYEIVAGERRFLAMKQLKSDTVPCFVRILSDEAAFEIQTTENLQRKDPDPIDEAFSYFEYIEKYGRTVEDLAVKFGKPLKFIAGRLRLIRLIPEALADVASGYLPLGHAFEIAKLNPEIQNQALELCYEREWNNKVDAYQPIKTKPQTAAKLRFDVQNKIFLSLKSARFSLKATDLRDDGLACVRCPERTGAAGSLFEELHENKNDRCLNAFCFNQKTARFVQIKRETESAAVVDRGEKPEGYRLKIIAWISSNTGKVEKSFGERPLFDGEYQTISNNSSECPEMDYGIFVDDTGKFGEVIKICCSKKCSRHKNRNSSSSDSASVPGEKSDAEKEAFYKRKQEIFDIKVGEPVRLKVLAEAAKTFTGEKWVFDDEKWRLRLVERIWSRIDDNARLLITEAIGREKHSLQEAKLKTLSTDELSRVLFLAMIANEGEMLWGSWRDQKEIIAAASEFGVDYALLDAQERVAAAPKKFVDAAKEHLGKIERGEKVTRPVFYRLEK